MSHSHRILRPDAKGRIGLGSLTRRIEERLGGRPVSGYAAEIAPDGSIVLRPHVEVNADDAETLSLDDADRDAFLGALADPAAPAERLRAAARQHARDVVEP